jgi:hypothetical protein
MLQLADRINALPGLLLDTSRLKGPWRTFGKLTAAVNPARLCFGSLWPVNLPECPLMQLRHEGLEAAIRDAILDANARRSLP